MGKQSQQRLPRSLGDLADTPECLRTVWFAIGVGQCIGLVDGAFVMVFGSLAAIFGLRFSPLGQLFLYPAYPFLFFFETVIAFFGKSDLVIHSNPLPLAVWIGYYLVLVSFVLM